MAANGNEAVSLSQLKALSDSIGAEVDGKVASPASAGTAGQVLSTNGTATEWIDLPEGTVYTGTAPITVSGSAIGITAASTGAAGSMSAADKAKLDGIDANANNYVLPYATSTVLGGIMLEDPSSISEENKFKLYRDRDNIPFVNIPNAGSTTRGLVTVASDTDFNAYMGIS